MDFSEQRKKTFYSFLKDGLSYKLSFGLKLALNVSLSEKVFEIGILQNKKNTKKFHSSSAQVP
jgi:hypothetical protein